MTPECARKIVVADVLTCLDRWKALGIHPSDGINGIVQAVVALAAASPDPAGVLRAIHRFFAALTLPDPSEGTSGKPS